jgi:hypothetical protein
MPFYRRKARKEEPGAVVTTYGSPLRTWRAETEISLNAMGYRGLAADPKPLPSGLFKAFEGPEGGERFWDAANSESLIDMRPVELRRFWLTEWVPIEPGLYSEDYSATVRRRFAEDYSYNEMLGPHYIPKVKATMRQGGLGCHRLGAVKKPGEPPYYILGATSSEVCDQGIPVRLSERDYGLVADEIREEGSVLASVGGRVTFIPEAVPGGRSQYRPTYGVDVEAIEPENGGTNDSLVACVFITFTAARTLEVEGTYDGRTRPLLTSYSHFRPGNRDGTLRHSVSWLNRYVEEYGDKRSRIVGDFDAYRSHLDRVEQPLVEIMAGRPNLEVLEDMSRRTGGLYVNSLVVNSDHFSNISSSTITTRSNIEMQVYEFGAE